MPSVTHRIKNTEQPHGGYVPPRKFSKIQLNDGIELCESENIHASLVGMAVDYLTRFMTGTPKEKAFDISMAGAERINETKLARSLLSNITGLDNLSIYNACRLVGFDVCFRAGPSEYRPVTEINPNADTIFNVAVMVQRCLDFWEKYGPIVSDGFTFEGAYTKTISSGDGDYLTQDTLWDFKVSKSPINTKQTLQLLVYYLMGRRSIHPEFQTIQQLGIYNPRLNLVRLYDIKNISKETIRDVESYVIGYDN